jgi:hypothetical protein
MYLNRWTVSVVLVLAGCARQDAAPQPVRGSATVSATASERPPAASASAANALTSAERSRLECLRDLYGVGITANGVRSAGGAVIPYDDGAKKTDEQRIEQADIEDTFAWPYPKLAPMPTAAPAQDPGRARSEPFLHLLYGEDTKLVESHLTSVPLFTQKVRVHQRVRGPLLRVVDRLEPVKTRADVRALFTDIGGTFNPRNIAGTDRLSAHAFGIAIDLNTKKSRYWRDNSEYKNEIPKEVVEAFEHEGFLWGGRWKHFDTMHFEYRPELTECAASVDAGAARIAPLP